MIRQEKEQDRKAVFNLNCAAFETPAEAKLVDQLRRSVEPLISLVCEDSGNIIGHIMFSPVEIDGLAEKQIMGLAPMAVSPDRQLTGIGSKLIEAGLQYCKDAGVGAVVVLGHTEYYPKFGFKPSIEYGFKSEYDVPDEVFMALELVPGFLEGAHGLARYSDVFKNV